MMFSLAEILGLASRTSDEIRAISLATQQQQSHRPVGERDGEDPPRAEQARRAHRSRRRSDLSEWRAISPWAFGSPAAAGPSQWKEALSTRRPASADPAPRRCALPPRGAGRPARLPPWPGGTPASPSSGCCRQGSGTFGSLPGGRGAGVRAGRHGSGCGAARAALLLASRARAPAGTEALQAVREALSRPRVAAAGAAGLGGGGRPGARAEGGARRPGSVSGRLLVIAPVQGASLTPRLLLDPAAGRELVGLCRAT
jgi:hypothetical protein